MHLKPLFLAFAISILFTGLVSGKEKIVFDKQPYNKSNPVVIMKTSMGDIYLEIYKKEVPTAADNFLGLAFGTKEFTDRMTGKKMKKKFYDGLTFHRVIPNFMVQGGCPLGTGTGDPGYKFNDEINPKFKHEIGTLAYANSGPDSNGCQFYITVVPTPFLDGGYTIFGQVLKGQDVANKISLVKRDPNDKPLETVRIVSIEKFEQDK